MWKRKIVIKAVWKLAQNIGTTKICLAGPPMQDVSTLPFVVGWLAAWGMLIPAKRQSRSTRLSINFLGHDPIRSLFLLYA